MAYIEHALQVECVQHFRAHYPSLAPLFFAVPNGGKRSRWEAQQLRTEGLWAGVADTLLLYPSGEYHGLCIEFKKQEQEWHKGKCTTIRGYQSKEQKEWQAAVEAQGYRYEIIRTKDEFKALLAEYLGQKAEN